MTALDRSSVRPRLLLMLLAVGIGADVLLGCIAFRNSRQALDERSFAHLTSLRAAKAAEIERYFGRVRNDVRTVAESVLVRTAVDELLPAYGAVIEVPAGCADDLAAFYREQVIPHVRLSGPTPDLAAWLPGTPEGTALQCAYLARNPRPLGEKDWLDDPGDGSAYSAVHARIQPGMRTLVERFGYHDLFVIDAYSGAIAYTAFKEPDFATSLVGGAYATSRLGAVFLRARSTTGDDVLLEDFAEYAPSLGAPAAFAATAIHRDGRVVAVLAVQLPVDRIEEIMTGGRQWEQDGLGKTGETYLIGADGRMRSDSRFLLEDPVAFHDRLVVAGAPADEIAGVDRFSTTILQLTVESDASRAARAGQSGTAVVTDYRGIPVLSSWAPLDLPELQWSLVSEMDLDEARQPVRVLFRQLVLATLALLLPIAAASVAFSARFAQPILAMMDDFGSLSARFESVNATLAQKTREIEAQEVEHGRLMDALRSVFGRSDAASDFLRGEVQTDGEERDVTVLVTDLKGFAAIAAHLEPKPTVAVLNAWFQAMGDVVDRHEGVVVEHAGDSFVAVFGAPNPVPGHPEKATRCALEMQARLAELDAKWKADGTAAPWQAAGFETIGSRIGVHTGTVVAGNVGRGARTKYAITGLSVNVAVALEAANDDLGTTVLVSAAVYDRLPEQLAVRATDRGPVHVKGLADEVFAYSF